MSKKIAQHEKSSAPFAELSELEQQTVKVSLKEKLYQQVVEVLDNYQVQPREPSSVGCVVSALILPCTFLYAFFLYLSMSGAPLIEVNNIRWSISYNPFPMNITCENPSGCYFSYQQEDAHSECQFLDAEQTAPMQVYRNPSNKPTVFILTAKTSEHMASALSATNSPDHRDGVGVMMSPIYGGYMLGALVETHNKTVKGKLAEHRHEWFFTLTHPFSTPQTFDGETCMAQAERAGLNSSEAQMAIVKMNPDYNFIEIEDGFSWLDYIGTTSGMYGLFLSAGAIILSVIELEVWTKALMRKVVVLE
mmetsp:Transcript_28750/g.39740  ORF Transcript_28750/g.39740 Transcript_28750/m.39740 type:complete len:306 (-) Transcript_28750:187-1104(-)|eukprot:CAMPEP_0196591988 /NCGR_PEP_ID=MMETSP1081-20130531/71517_1 /TAXON_ID=36882 /ORGANISM="Pyramimonas amylifera, Strain CCMP720" /LENGTH=305 /DNA_ID=CAMNT_0041915537 /DNA_START=160 /DNA_END=1077 /DNA_ORIENTATION=-